MLLQVLVLSPVAEYPTPESLKRLEHEYSLREELDPAWAARPIAMARHWDRTVLVLEDPGGVPLDQLLGQPLDLAFSLRLAIGLSSRDRSLASARHYPQGHQAGQCSGELRHRPVLADGLWYRVAASTRAPGSRTSRVDRRDARLHGTRADRTDESFDRFAERSLFARRHALRNADWESSIHGVRSDGMGALPHCQTAGAAQRAVEECPGPGLCNHHEAARQDGRGTLPDSRRR